MQQDTCTETGQSELEYWSKNKLSVTLTLGYSLEYTRAARFYVTNMGVGENVKGNLKFELTDSCLQHHNTDGTQH